MRFPERECYFLAFDAVKIQTGAAEALPSKRFLVALNYLHKVCPTPAEKRDWLKHYFDLGYHVMLDSGCFTLCFAKADELGITPPEAFMMSPADWGPELEAHIDLYCESLAACKQYLTTYVEVDIGSLAERAARRRMMKRDFKLEPMPVFRMFNDPLSELPGILRANKTLCIAGTAFCPMVNRVRAWHEAWRQWKEHNPSCKLHVLGVTPCSTFNSFGFTSSDSSTFSASCRYGQGHGYNFVSADSRVPWLPAIPMGVLEGIDKKVEAVINTTAFSHSVFAMGKVAMADERSRFPR